MATEKMTREETYLATLEELKKEHNELLPSYNRIVMRMRLIKHTIQTLSSLCDVDVEEDYKFFRARQGFQHNLPNARKK